MPKKKQRSRYGDYCEKIDGALYASVNLPLGNGKYKRKRKRVENATEARQWALQQLHGQRYGETISDKADGRLSFSRLADWYADEFLFAPVYQQGVRVLGLRTYKRQKTMVERLKLTFGEYFLNNLTVDVLRRYKRDRLRTAGVTAINRDFALMRTMFKKARARKWMDENPFDLGENLIETALEPSRKSPLTTRIAKRLLARSRKSESPRLFYLVLVVMHTGARPSEVFPYEAQEGDDIKREPLNWQNILEFDFQAVRLVSYKGKVRKEKIVPTTVELERGLRQFYWETKPDSTDLLFPQTSFKTAWATLCRNTRVRGVRLRDFRHYYNSKILNIPTINDVERMLLLGQTQLPTNLRYSALDETFINKYRAALSPTEIHTTQ